MNEIYSNKTVKQHTTFYMKAFTVGTENDQ